ncbi:MAG: S9 family peptidase, partial [Candidatus Methanomethylicota archaeon]
MEDPYVWMENLEDPKVIDWALNENKRTKTVLRELSSKLVTRIEKYYSIPYILATSISKRGCFTLIREENSFKIKLYLQNGEIVELIDSKDLGKEIVIKGIQASKDGSKLAFSYSKSGADVGLLKIIDVDTREEVDEIKGVVWDIVWLEKDRYYYVKLFREEPPPDGVAPPTTRVMLRESGKDEMVWGEGIPTSYFIDIKPSSDNSKALLNVSYGWSKSTVYGGDLKNPESWNKIYGDNLIAAPIDYLNQTYLIASYEDDGLGKIIAISNGLIKTVVDEQDYPLQEAVTVNGKIVAHYLKDASSILRTFSLNGKLEDEVKFDVPGTVKHLNSKGDEAAFIYESFFTPYRLYTYNGKTLKLIDSREIANDFIVEEAWTKSSDGTRIHMFIAKKRKTKLEKVLVYGYGGFRISKTPVYDASIIPFIEDGGVYVVANIRGGLEYGEKWHKDGMRDKKQNVFNDFIAAIKYFKDKGAKVVAIGRSNGGLLVSAVLTQKPELLDGAVIGYPVIDMMRFHKLYIGKAWIPEYGDPDNPKDAEYLLKYSPYHNVRQVKYPPILVYTGLHDDRVHPAHAFKFVAKLKEVNAPVLLRVETSSGHSGATPKTKIKEHADIMAFIYKVLGMAD